jgi:DNA replication protein DnaC
LDDLGAEKESDWTTEKIFEVIDARGGKHTITTTNLSSVDLADKIGKRNFSRLILDTEIIKLEGEDMREKTFKKGN